MQTPPMPTPTPTPTGGPLPTQKKQLTGKQGCLIFAGAAMLLLGFLVAAAFLNKPQADGLIVISSDNEQTSLVPFGCVNTIGEVAIPLRDEEPAEGFHVEERKLVVRDPRQDTVIPSGPIPTVVMSYVDAEKREHAIGDCSRLENTLARGTTRFRILSEGSRTHRRSDWTGALEADCALPDGRTISIALKLTDCR